MLSNTTAKLAIAGLSAVCSPIVLSFRLHENEIEKMQFRETKACYDFIPDRYEAVQHHSPSYN